MDRVQDTMSNNYLAQSFHDIDIISYDKHNTFLFLIARHNLLIGIFSLSIFHSIDRSMMMFTLLTIS